MTKSLCFEKDRVFCPQDGAPSPLFSGHRSWYHSMLWCLSLMWPCPFFDRSSHANSWHRLGTIFMFCRCFFMPFLPLAHASTKFGNWNTSSCYLSVGLLEKSSSFTHAVAVEADNTVFIALYVPCGANIHDMTWQEFVLMWRPCPHNKSVMGGDWNSIATKTRWLQMQECVNSCFPFPYTLYPAQREVRGELKHRPCCRFKSQSIQCVSAVLLLHPFCVNTSIYTLGEHATLKKRCPAFDKKAWRLVWLMIVVSVYWWWPFMQRFMHVLFEINSKAVYHAMSCVSL